MKVSITLLTQAALLILPAHPTLAQQPAVAERIVLLKASLAAKDAGKFAFQSHPGQRARMIFADYLKAGDSLALDVDLASNRPLAAQVSSHLASQKEPVTVAVRFGTLNNSAAYASTIVFEAKAKQLKVNVQNSGYRKAGN